MKDRIKKSVFFGVYSAFLSTAAGIMVLYGFGGAFLVSMGIGYEGYLLWLSAMKIIALELFIILSLALSIIWFILNV